MVACSDDKPDSGGAAGTGESSDGDSDVDGGTTGEADDGDADADDADGGEDTAVDDTGSTPSVWSPGLTVSPSPVAGADADSSTRLVVAFAAPPEGVDHVEVKAAQEGGVHSRTQVAESGATSVVLNTLKMSTTYAVTVRACVDADCTADVGQQTENGTTAEEVWEIQGTGHDWDGMTVIAEDSSVLAYPVVYGEGAPEELVGFVRLYFKTLPLPGLFRADIRTALSPGLPTADVSSVSSFVVDEGAGFRDPETPIEHIEKLAAVQAIPLTEEMGGKTRMFFEAEAEDGTNTLFQIDSVDGLVGADFNPSESTLMDTHEDWSELNPPQIAIGTEGTGLWVVRQSKLAYPKMDDWRWNGSTDTFMMITGGDDCGQTNDGIFHADWTGTDWSLGTDADGCAKPVALNAHGPVVVHLGGNRYKLYYEERQESSDEPKPVRVLYIDGGTDVEHWEPESAARDIQFRWPDGTPLTDAEESGTGDHVIYRPTGEPDYQVMYVNLNGRDNPEDSETSNGVGVAKLLNP